MAHGSSLGAQHITLPSRAGASRIDSKGRRKAWKPFVGDAVPREEVPTGDAAFDARFSVRCADANWVQAVLEPPVRARLLELPLLFLVQTDQKVIFPLYFDGTRLFTATGVSMREAWGVMDRTPLFLDAAILLVESMSVARQG